VGSASGRRLSSSASGVCRGTRGVVGARGGFARLDSAVRPRVGAMMSGRRGAPTRDKRAAHAAVLLRFWLLTAGTDVKETVAACAHEAYGRCCSGSSGRSSRASASSSRRSWCRCAPTHGRSIVAVCGDGVARARMAGRDAGVGGRLTWGPRSRSWRPTRRACTASSIAWSWRRSRGRAISPGSPSRLRISAAGWRSTRQRRPSRS